MRALVFFLFTLTGSAFAEPSPIVPGDLVKTNFDNYTAYQEYCTVVSVDGEKANLACPRADLEKPCLIDSSVQYLNTLKKLNKSLSLFGVQVGDDTIAYQPAQIFKAKAFGFDPDSLEAVVQDASGCWHKGLRPIEKAKDLPAFGPARGATVYTNDGGEEGDIIKSYPVKLTAYAYEQRFFVDRSTTTPITTLEPSYIIYVTSKNTIKSLRSIYYYESKELEQQFEQQYSLSKRVALDENFKPYIIGKILWNGCRPELAKTSTACERIEGYSRTPLAIDRTGKVTTVYLYTPSPISASNLINAKVGDAIAKNKVVSSKSASRDGIVGFYEGDQLPDQLRDQLRQFASDNQLQRYTVAVTSAPKKLLLFTCDGFDPRVERADKRIRHLCTIDQNTGKFPPDTFAIEF